MKTARYGWIAAVMLGVAACGDNGNTTVVVTDVPDTTDIQVTTDTPVTTDVQTPDAGSCGTGLTRCGTDCVNTQNSASNCGSCGNACATGESCTGGSCQTPMPCTTTGQTRCAGTCTDTSTDATNCGACGTACSAGQSCVSGACMTTTTCPTGQTACSGTCTNTMTDVANCGACGHACTTGQTCTGGTCGAAMCPTGQMLCGGACANTQTDTMNCGSCGHACAMGQTCAAGACTGSVTCPTGQMMCGSACADLATDAMNCGSCGHACATGQTCTASACVAGHTCPTGQTDCTPTGATATCVDTQTSGANCGSCGNACGTGLSCTAGVCGCATGQMLCGTACVNTQTDGANCGACGHACPTGQTCAAGACACATGQILCSGACVNGQTDNANCGACGHACPTGQTCAAGACACATGQMLCGTACANTQTDRANCGTCGHACAASQTCAGGTCACPTGQTTCSGACVDTQTNAANCGTCGHACTGGMACAAGACNATPPANDLRANATAIDLTMPSVTIAATTVAATNNTTGACGCTSGGDVFYRFVLAQPEVVYADTLGSTADTSLFFQDMAGANLTLAAPNVTCNDDNAAAGFCAGIPATAGASAYQSQIAARLAAGTYFLVLSGCSAGASMIHFQHVPAGNGPSARITPGATETTAMGTTSGTGTVSSTCSSSGPDNSYWWITCPGTAAQNFYASTCSATDGTRTAAYDTEIAEYSALRAASVCNDDVGAAYACGTGSSMTAAIPATTALQAGLNAVVMDGFNVGGTYTMRYVLAASCASGARCGAACVDTTSDNNNCGGCDRRCIGGTHCFAGNCGSGPANDVPTGAVTINMAVPSSTFTVDTTYAVNNATGTCGCTGGHDVFYAFTLTAPEIVYADTLGSPFDTSLFVQTSAGVNVTATGLPTGGLACDDDGGLGGCNTGLQSQILVSLPAGSYRLVLSGCSQGVANLRFQHLPLGNGAAAYLGAGASTPAGITVGTGRVTAASCTSAGAENTYYWYTCSASTGGTFTASTCGRASWDTELEQRSAGRTTPGVGVCNDDGGGTCGVQSSVTTTIPAGAGLHTLYVDGYLATSAGAYTVSVSRP